MNSPIGLATTPGNSVSIAGYLVSYMKIDEVAILLTYIMVILDNFAYLFKLLFKVGGPNLVTQHLKQSSMASSSYSGLMILMVPSWLKKVAIFNSFANLSDSILAGGKVNHSELCLSGRIKTRHSFKDSFHRNFNLIIAALIEFQGLKLQQGHADDDRD